MEGGFSISEGIVAWGSHSDSVVGFVSEPVTIFGDGLFFHLGMEGGSFALAGFEVEGEGMGGGSGFGRFWVHGVWGWGVATRVILVRG